MVPPFFTTVHKVGWGTQAVQLQHVQGPALHHSTERPLGSSMQAMRRHSLSEPRSEAELDISLSPKADSQGQFEKTGETPYDISKPDKKEIKK